MGLTRPGDAANLCLVLRRLFKLLAVLAVVWSLGTHWAMVQTAAWVRMAIHHSAETSVTEAVGRVLGGQNPCRICKWVREGRANESRNEALLERGPLEFEVPSGITLESEGLVLEMPAIVGREVFWKSWVVGPPKPRPKWLDGSV
jgi:hypothetical protein